VIRNAPARPKFELQRRFPSGECPSLHADDDSGHVIVLRRAGDEGVSRADDVNDEVTGRGCEVRPDRKDQAIVTPLLIGGIHGLADAISKRHEHIA
jgi:hypothetical protein